MRPSKIDEIVSGGEQRVGALWRRWRVAWLGWGILENRKGLQVTVWYPFFQF